VLYAKSHNFASDVLHQVRSIKLLLYKACKKSECRISLQLQTSK